MAGRPRKFTKGLTTDERTMPETIARSRTEEKRRVERAEVILGCTAGMSNVAIAEKLHISKPTVVKILKKWTMFGVNSALEDLQRTGRPAKIRIEAKAWVISLACTKPGDLPGVPMSQQWTISVESVKQDKVTNDDLELFVKIVGGYSNVILGCAELPILWDRLRSNNFVYDILCHYLVYFGL